MEKNAASSFAEVKLGILEKHIPSTQFLSSSIHRLSDAGNSTEESISEFFNEFNGATLELYGRI